MTDNTFKIEFEIVANDRARVFLNDSAVGYVRIHEFSTSKKRAFRLSYRCSSSPFKHVITTSPYTDLTQTSVAECLKDNRVYRQIVSAAIRDSLHGYQSVEVPLRIAA